MGRGSTSALLGTLACLVATCNGGAFECDDDPQCADGDVLGLCEPNGFCSFPDEDCDSGRRYGDRAGNDLAGECVVPEATTSSGVDPLTTTMPGSEVGSLDTVADDGSESTDAPDTGAPATTGGSACPADWHDCGFARRRRVSAVPLRDASVTDFPVRLGLDSSFDWDAAASDGSDVRFHGDDGIAYPHEIERWDPGVAAEIWIRWPSLGGVEAVDGWMYYGHDGPPPAPPVAEVWSNGYLAVWHMVDGADSTDNLPLEAQNTMAVEGRVGGAQLFDGTSSRMTAAMMIMDPFAEGATMSAWIEPEGWGSSAYGRIIDLREMTPGSPGWSWHVNNSTAPISSLRFTEGYSGSGASWNSPGDVLALGTWFGVAVAYRRGDVDVPMQFWIDGVAVTTTNDDGSDGEYLPSTSPLTIGALAGGNDRFFDGVIDEVRIATSLRDDAWMAYESASVAQDLVVLGDPESHR